MNVKVRHYNSFTANHNRTRIYEIIEPRLSTGVVQKEIQAETGFTRQTVSFHLAELVRQGKIYFKNSENDKKIKVYYPQDRDIENINMFSRSIEEAGIRIIDPGLINVADDEFSEWKARSEPYPRLCSKVLNITVSDRFCKSNFSKRDINEMLLFEFVNRAGALIAYIFIESMKPLTDKNFESSKDKKRLCSILFNNAINIQEIFQQFCSLFRETGMIKKENNEGKYPELDEISFSNLQDVFKNVYPKIYDGLEDWWKSKMKYYLSVWYRQMAENNDCPHKWEKTYLYKYGTCYRCYKCNVLVDTPVINETIKKRRLG